MIAAPVAGAAKVTDQAYRRLRADLLGGRLVPGARLRIGDLCQDTGFAMNAVREALARLRSEGLVVSAPQRGLHAAPVSKADLCDVMHARTAIEILCLRRAIACGDVAWEAGVMAASHALSRTPPGRSLIDDVGQGRWAAAHQAFHDALCAGCDNHWLLRVRALLHVQSERYRNLSLRLSRGRRDAGDEHDALRDAVIARDADRAATLIEAHLTVTTAYLLQAMVGGDAAAAPPADPLATEDSA